MGKALLRLCLLTAVCFQTELARQSPCKDPQSRLIQYLAGPRADHGTALRVLGRALGVELLAQLSNLSADVSQIMVVAILQRADGCVSVRLQYMQGGSSALAVSG